MLARNGTWTGMPTYRQSGRADATGAVDSWLYDEQLQPGSDSSEIGRVAGDDKLSSSPRTNDDMGIDDVRRPGPRQ